MKRLIWEDETEDIDLGDGDFITVTAGATVGDIAKIGMSETRGEFSLALLRILIKGWHGPSFEKNGEPVPCTPENIARLSAGIAQELTEKLSQRIVNERMSEETKKPSTETSLNT